MRYRSGEIKMKLDPYGSLVEDILKTGIDTYVVIEFTGPIHLLYILGPSISFEVQNEPWET